MCVCVCVCVVYVCVCVCMCVCVCVCMCVCMCGHLPYIPIATTIEGFRPSRLTTAGAVKFPGPSSE